MPESQVAAERELAVQRLSDGRHLSCRELPQGVKNPPEPNHSRTTSAAFSVSEPRREQSANGLVGPKALKVTLTTEQSHEGSTQAVLVVTRPIGPTRPWTPKIEPQQALAFGSGLNDSKALVRNAVRSYDGLRVCRSSTVAFDGLEVRRPTECSSLSVAGSRLAGDERR